MPASAQGTAVPSGWPQAVAPHLLSYLGESLHSDVFLVELPKEPDKRYILKRIRARYQIEGLLESLRVQISQLEKLDLPHSTIPSIRSTETGEICLLRPAFDGVNLWQWKDAESRSIADSLHVAHLVATHLQEFHAAGHIHTGIKPTNILVAMNSNSVQIIDAVRILDINDLSHYISAETFCRQTLPYLAPEQTGRICPSLDYTTDLYAFGATLYELLTGAPPFASLDPLATIHSHLAEIPLQAQSRRPDLPYVVGEILSALLEKRPEKRYQTAKGLAHDLGLCLTQLREGSIVASFPIRRKDYSNRITIPSIMVGRDRQKAQLLAQFQAVCKGEFRAVFVSGLSGVGKTRLVQELELPIVAAHGYYASGKFDQYRRHIPYSTLIQAFRQLMRVVLTEDTDRVRRWKQRVLAEVGQQGSLLVDIIPELETICGPQPKVPTLSPTEARNRFLDTISKFLKSLATMEHPLTLFIDDLQWCDDATFDVLDMLFGNVNEHPHLFWIGAYRHNEVGPNHRLARLLERLSARQQPFTTLRLEALALDDVNEMTAYILNTWPSKTRALSEAINKTSEGNPLFVNESLLWLHTHRHLQLGDNGVWTWEDDQIRHTAIPTTASELFTAKIQQLSDPTKSLLLLAACLGATFDAADLALCAGTDLAGLYETLSPAFAVSLLKKNKRTISFFHDQVQAAAKNLLSDDGRRVRHAKIADALRGAIPTNAVLHELPSLFSIVEHMVLGRLPDAPAEQRHLEAHYHYEAGVRAMNEMAMGSANHFFREARSLYPEDNWHADYDFLFSLHKQLARTEMAIGNQPASEAMMATLLQRARNDLDKADCLYEQTAGLSSMGVFERAIALGNEGLDYFGRRIPDDDEVALAESAKILGRIHEGDTDVWQAILDVEPSTERAIRIETAIYSELIPDYYLAGMVPQLYLAAIQSTANCLDGGVDESVIYGFSMVGLYLQRQDRYELSFRYEDLGLALASRYPASFGATKGVNGILWTNMHNRRTPSHIIEECWQNIERGRDCGDLYNSGLSYGPLLWNMVAQGDDLERIVRAANECVDFSSKFHLSLSLGLAQSALAGWADEMLSDRPLPQEDHITSLLETWENARHVVSIGGYHTLRGIANHYLQRTQQAEKHLNAAEPYLRGLSDNILNRLWYVFVFLNDAAQAAADGKPAQATARMTMCLERVEIWSTLGPSLRPYLALMHAELAATEGNDRKARSLYFDAQCMASSAGYTLLEGYCTERLGRRLQEHSDALASFHLDRARTLYRQCRATAMCARLGWGDSPLEEPTPPVFVPDVEYTLRASRAISQELRTASVQQVIMHAIMERLGATHGFLLMASSSGGEDLCVAVSGKKDEGRVTVSVAGENALSELPISMALVRYTYRSGAPLRLDDVLQDERFRYDDTIRRFHVRSVLCEPIMHQRRRLGVICLQNTELCGAFAPEAQLLVRTLATQAAISLQNAALCQKLSESEKTLSAILENTPALITIKDLHGRYILVSEEYKQISARSLAAILGKTDRDLFPADIAQSLERRDHEVLYTQRGLEFEEVVSSPRGPRTFVSSKCCLFDGEHQPYAVCTVSTEITERKRAERSLAEREALLARAENVGGLGSLEVEVATGALRISHNLCCLLGIEAGEPPATIVELAALMQTEERLHMIDDITAGMHTEGQFSKEYVLGGPANEQTLRFVAERIPDPDDGCARLVGIVQDVTVLRRDEARSRQAQKMEAVGRLAGGIAHDFSNMLTPILLYSSALLRRPSEQAAISTGLTEIHRAATAAAGIIRNLLTFSDARPPAPRPISIASVLEEMSAILRRLIREDIEIVFDDGSEVGCALFDEGQIEQIIVNFALNAQDAMPSGGVLRFSVHAMTEQEMSALRNVELAPGEYIDFTVTDTGIGMDEATQARIFEPFFTTKPKGRGTGLGLAATRAAVKQHGGAITVTSGPVGGTTFHVYLPQCELVTVSEDTTLQDDDSEHHAVICLVEDNEFVRNALKEILAGDGHEVMAASTAHEALAHVRNFDRDIDLVVTDLVLPDIDGRELGRRMRALKPSVALLYLTGYSDKVTSPTQSDDPDVELLHKPFGPDVLRAAVQRALHAHEEA